MSAADQVAFRILPVEEIELIRHLWLELTEHHWRCAPRISALAAPVDAQASWVRRRKQYQSWSAEPGWLLIVAEAAGDAADGTAGVLGYAAARIMPAASSWDFGRSVGKLETLVVHSSVRRRGTGRQLFERVRQHWRQRGITYGSVSVIAGNSDAACFYERSGAVEYTRTSCFTV